MRVCKSIKLLRTSAVCESKLVQNRDRCLILLEMLDNSASSAITKSCISPATTRSTTILLLTLNSQPYRLSNLTWKIKPSSTMESKTALPRISIFSSFSGSKIPSATHI
ncbi:unnamed protein product [Coffea canephora]|uniref:Uncharacterized protein n=1 Tax=Coffea canephora TaxID=49390 RepID=A0A068V9C7_COFCA|nr:unnamed protein product [Coffea canephora]